MRDNDLRDIIVFVIFILLIIWAVRLSGEAQYDTADLEFHQRTNAR